MTPNELYSEAVKRGLRLRPSGDMLAVIPKGRCSPDFMEVLRQHKPELLAWLEARCYDLPLDCAPWLHVARQVVTGEFDNADDSMRESVIIGLGRIPHPLCREALAHIRGIGL